MAKIDEFESTEYSEQELEILEFLSKKYDIHIDNVIEAFEVGEVELGELSDYINGGDRINKTDGRINVTTRRPKADIEETIKIFCPVVKQILSGNSEEEYDFSKIPDEDTYNYEETPYPSWRVK